MEGKQEIIGEVDNFTYQALRRYWAEHDMDRGAGYPFVWDLRIGAVNRWPDDIRTRLNPGTRSIHYTLYLRRADAIDDAEYLEKYGQFPAAPGAWMIVWDEGTFKGPYNEAAIDEWEVRMQPHLKEPEDVFNRWYDQNPPPPQFLPTPENWGPDRAREELEKIIPEAQRRLVEEDPKGLRWEPRKFIITDPEDPPSH